MFHTVDYRVAPAKRTDKIEKLNGLMSELVPNMKPDSRHSFQWYKGLNKSRGKLLVFGNMFFTEDLPDGEVGKLKGFARGEPPQDGSNPKYRRIIEIHMYPDEIVARAVLDKNYSMAVFQKEILPYMISGKDMKIYQPKKGLWKKTLGRYL
jgi:hypothetical protein